MEISLLLKLQIGYMTLGIVYNLASILLKAHGVKPLSSSDPIFGLVAMLVFGLLLIPGFLHFDRAYRIIMGISVIIYGYFGVITNILKHSHMELYYSEGAWLSAIAINLIGVILNLIAVSGMYKS